MTSLHLYAGHLPSRQRWPEEGPPAVGIPQGPADVPGVAAELDVGPHVVTAVQRASLQAAACAQGERMTSKFALVQTKFKNNEQQAKSACSALARVI
jgi:hypothetical protein